MKKHFHEVRDAVHVFVHLDSDERAVLDSRAFQRLRHIHQLALTHLVYPGATHRRFEHSLGVMELAGRVFDVVTVEKNRDNRARDIFPPQHELNYWRRALRMAALCHDLGHLPFSHAAESQLLPEGRTHESLTVDLIESDEMKAILEKVTPPPRPGDVAKLAVGAEKLKGQRFDQWERILAEIIVGDSFGVDRMDYLLRDSLHAGVVYGKFDQYRLIDSLRILPESADEAAEPVLGIDFGGLQSAEALLLARYFMFSQVYCHPVRRAYDIHLQDFLIAWLGEKGVPVDREDFLRFTDNEVLAEISKANADQAHPGHDSARRIVNRSHFRVLYERNPGDADKNPEAGEAVFKAACNKFGADYFRHDRYRQGGSDAGFPVKTRYGRIVSSLIVSDVLKKVPLVNVDYVFVAPEIRDQAEGWLGKNRSQIIVQMEEDDQ